MYSANSSSPKSLLKKEEEELVNQFVRFLRKKVSLNEYPKKHIDELKGVLRSLENVFHLTGNGFDEADQKEKTSRANVIKEEGNKLYREKKYDAAIEKYTAAIELHHDSTYFLNRGLANYYLQNYGKSIEDCQKAVSLNDKYAKAYYRLGLALGKKGYLEKALHALHKASELDPSNNEYESDLSDIFKKYQQGVNRHKAFDWKNAALVSQLDTLSNKIEIKSENGLQRENSKTSETGDPPWKNDGDNLLRKTNEMTTGYSQKKRPSAEDLLDAVSMPLSDTRIQKQSLNKNTLENSTQNRNIGNNLVRMSVEEEKYVLENVEITHVGEISDIHGGRGGFSDYLNVCCASQPQDYIIEKYSIINFKEVAPMKHTIAKNVESVTPRHLLNLWKYRNFRPFPELVLLYQYIYRFTMTESFTLDTYQKILDLIVRHERVFRSCIHFAREVELMLELRFLCIPDPPDKRQIAINKEINILKMIPLAHGMPSILMEELINSPDGQVCVGEFNNNSGYPPEFFIHDLLETLNWRPDLFILHNDSDDDDFYRMDIELNQKICKDFIVCNYELRDLRKVEDMHLERDQIDSISQFIPHSLKN